MPITRFSIYDEPLPKRLIDVFKSYIEFSDDCWIFNGPTHSGKYVFNHRHKRYNSARLSYELFIGRLDPDKKIKQLCAIDNCVHPEHLYVVGEPGDPVYDMDNAPINQYTSPYFLEKFIKSEGCWEWLGAMVRTTPVFSYKDSTGRWTTKSARKYSYENHYRIMLDKHDFLRSACGNIRCVNPEHIYVPSKEHLIKKIPKPQLYMNLTEVERVIRVTSIDEMCERIGAVMMANDRVA